MSTKTLRGLPFALRNTRSEALASKAEKKNEAVKQELARPEQKGLETQGRYQNSFDAQGQVNRDYKRTFARGDTSDLFTPNATPSKLGNMLGRLPSVTLKEGSFERSVTGFEREGSFSGMGGLAQGQGRISGGEAYVRGEGSIGLEGGALKATGTVQASATLVDAQGSIRIGRGDYTLDAQGQAYVGARAQANGELTIDPARGIYAAKVGGEAFAGARAGVEANVSLGQFGSAGGKAEAWAGVGVAFNAELGFKNGRFKAKLDIGAALGIGFKLGFNVDIDLNGIKNAIKDTVNKVIREPLNVVRDIGSAIGKGLKKLKFW